MESITIANDVKTINEKAFQSISTLKTVIIGSTVQTIRDYVFTFCNNLESFSVGANNQGGYQAIDRVLFDKTSLIHYPQQKKDKTYVIPDGYTEIKGYAFYNNEYLDYVKLNDDITTIGDNAFEGVTNVRTITLPQSLTLIRL